MNSHSNVAPAGAIRVVPGLPSRPIHPAIPWALVGILLILVVLVGTQAITSLLRAGPQTVTVREPQAGSQVTLRTGDTLQVALEANPTTGYTWVVAQADPAILQLAGDPEFQPASELMGAGGTTTYRFTTVGAGETTLQLVYARVVEPTFAPLKTYTVAVAVTSR
jgi:inhibitor of cysteine peptidase